RRALPGQGVELLGDARDQPIARAGGPPGAWRARAGEPDAEVPAPHGHQRVEQARQRGHVLLAAGVTGVDSVAGLGAGRRWRPRIQARDLRPDALLPLLLPARLLPLAGSGADQRIAVRAR